VRIRWVRAPYSLVCFGTGFEVLTLVRIRWVRALYSLVCFGTGFEVLTLVRIDNGVWWVRAPYSLVCGYECSGEHSGAVFTGHQKLYVLTETAVLTNQIAQPCNPEH